MMTLISPDLSGLTAFEGTLLSSEAPQPRIDSNVHWTDLFYNVAMADDFLAAGSPPGLDLSKDTMKVKLSDRHEGPWDIHGDRLIDTDYDRYVAELGEDVISRAYPIGNGARVAMGYNGRELRDRIWKITYIRKNDVVWSDYGYASNVEEATRKLGVVTKKILGKESPFRDPPTTKSAFTGHAPSLVQLDGTTIPASNVEMKYKPDSPPETELTFPAVTGGEITGVTLYDGEDTQQFIALPNGKITPNGGTITLSLIADVIVAYNLTVPYEYEHTKFGETRLRRESPVARSWLAVKRDGA